MHSQPGTHEHLDTFYGRHSNRIVLAALLCVVLLAICFGASDLNRQSRPQVQNEVRHYHPIVTSTRAQQVLEAVTKLRKRSRAYASSDRLNDYANMPGFITLMGSGVNEKFFWPSNTERGHDFYGGRWAAENIQSGASGAELIIKKVDNPVSPYSMPEIRTHKFYGYGRYEVVFQPAAGSGLVSAFFTYTGPYAGDPHDEIDIEFLGKDTTKVHFNYFRNGRKGNFATFDLPFDAAEAPHLYAFEWTPRGITWFVDGVPYYQISGDDPRMPQAPGRIYMSTWTGVKPMQQWHGAPSFESGTASLVACVSFQPMGYDTRSCADVHTSPDGKLN